MRVFIAIEFSTEQKRLISDLQAKVRPITSKGRFKHADNFHLTLKFIGEVNDKQIDDINKKLALVAKNSSRFVLRLEKLGCFAGKEMIKTLWLGVGGEIEKLYILHKNIDKALDEIGFPPEARAYKPHITVGQDIILTENFDSLVRRLGKYEFPEIVVDSIFLIKSEQIGSKRVYTPLGQHSFFQ